MKKTALALFSCIVANLSSLSVLATKSAPAEATTSTPTNKLEPPAGMEKITSVEGITEYRLANGLRVLFAPEPSKPTTTVNITYLVGSRHENYGETGMAHLLEHLMFKGTPDYPDLNNALDKRGMHNNATTSYDRTNYFETFSAGDTNLEWALKMEADRMVNSFIARKDLDTEMTVVRNEFEKGENDAENTLFKYVTATAFHWHNYGKTTIGTRSDIENVAIENLQAFYKKYYQPDNAVLIVAGQFDEAKALRWIGQYFGPLGRSQTPRPAFYTVEPTQEGPRQVQLERSGSKQYLQVLYRVSNGAHADHALLSLCNSILADTPEGRLHKALVENKEAVVVGNFTPGLTDPGFALFAVELKQDQPINTAQEKTLSIIEGLKQKPITQEELNLAKKRLLNQFEQITRDPQKLGVALSESIALGDWRLFFLNRDRIADAQLAEVQRVGEHYFKAANRTLGLFTPNEKTDRTAIPANQDIAKLLANYQGKAQVAQGEAFVTTPENIEKRTTRETLLGGLKVAFLPKKTRGETVALSLKLNLGNEKALENQYPAGTMLAALLDRGTKHKNRQELQRTLDSLKTTLQIQGDERQLYLRAETTREYLPKLLPLLAEIVKEPALAQSELEIARNEWLASIEGNSKQPQGIAQNALQKLLNGHFPAKHILASRSFDEQLALFKSLSLEKVRAFHTDFYGLQSAQLALVGDFDTTTVRPILEQSFGAWPAKTPYTRVANPYFKVEGQEFKFETPDKANAILIAVNTFALQDTSPDYPALLIANEVFGGGGFSARILKRLREKEGISYGAGSTLNTSSEEARSNITAYAILAPQNRAKAVQAFKEEVALLLKEGITKAELEDAKVSLLEARNLQRAQDPRLSGSLVEQLYLGRTMAFSAEVEAKINAMTLETVNQAIQKYLANPFSIITAGDFAKAERTPAVEK